MNVHSAPLARRLLSSILRMLLAHPVTLLPMIVAVACLGACSGGGGEQAPEASDADVFLPDVSRDANILPSGGWRSFTVTFAAETTTFKVPSTSPLPVLMAGKRMRLDFDNGAFRSTHLAGAALIDEFADPVGFGGTATVPLIMYADRERGGAFVVHRVTTTGTIDMRFDSLLFDLDAHALPAGGVAKGAIYVLDAGRSYYGEVTAAFGATEDRDAPRWRASARSSFGPVPLPWDVRVAETSEPYEGHVTSTQLFSTSTIEAQPLQTTLSWGTPPKDRERGLTFLLHSWDDAGALTSSGAKVRDLAGNVSVERPLTVPGVAVVKLDADAFEPGPDTLKSLVIWGSPHLEDCPDLAPAAPCVAIGPVSMSLCAPYSIAGLATRLRGHGPTSLVFRATAAVDGSFGGVPSNALSFASAIPGVPARIDFTSLRWPTKGPAGTFDTGWTTLTLPALGTADETGVALSLGGLGAPLDPVSCGTPYHVTVTVHLRSIAVSAGP
jgi:hypothetical protein